MASASSSPAWFMCCASPCAVASCNIFIAPATPSSSCLFKMRSLHCVRRRLSVEFQRFWIALSVLQRENATQSAATPHNAQVHRGTAKTTTIADKFWPQVATLKRMQPSQAEQLNVHDPNIDPTAIALTHRPNRSFAITAHLLGISTCLKMMI